MAGAFDPGYGQEPFATLVTDCPGDEVFPVRDFRLEWGPIFHRGRLDGTARVVVIGQDPGSHEAFIRRVLVGEAGQRLQGFLARLGIDSSYTMINSFVYSVFGQHAANRHRADPAIATYRNRWLDALLVDADVEAVITVGRSAAVAFELWRASPMGKRFDLTWTKLMHPTFPEAASLSGSTTYAEAMATMLEGWNEALEILDGAITERDRPVTTQPYDTELNDDDVIEIPAADLPAGLPAWMRAVEPWCFRDGSTTDTKRATLVARVPTMHRPWEPFD